MSRARALLDRLEHASDWLSPIVVKEVRQAVRGREFHYSFAITLLVGLAVAFFGAADALSGNGASGRWTFAALMSCLTFLGLAVVPLGAFSALRNERLEQTLELITLSALSPRRVVIGKLLAQGVKLATLFAGLAPFIAMSFLLGGIDFGTILVSLPIVFLWSMWACAACLFLSSLLKTRAMSGLIFGGVGVVLFLFLFVFGLPRLFFLMSRGAFGGMSAGFGAMPGSQSWWQLAIMTTICLATMGNLVLLAENRLSLPTEDRVTTLRAGFFGQFLLIAAWTLSFINESPVVRSSAAQALGVVGGLHLAVVAMFTVTEDLVVSRRVLLRMNAVSPWRRLLAILGPGGGRGALYVLAQMALYLAAAWLLRPTWVSLRWFLAVCGYICFFTGVPAAAFRAIRPAGAASFQLRAAVLVMLFMALILPDIVYYLLFQPTLFELRYAGRHLFNPIRTLANWRVVEANHGFAIPVLLGLTGLAAYLTLIGLGRRMTAPPAPIDPPTLVAVNVGDQLRRDPAVAPHQVAKRGAETDSPSPTAAAVEPSGMREPSSNPKLQAPNPNHSQRSTPKPPGNRDARWNSPSG
jgi:hypothetical protein